MSPALEAAFRLSTSLPSRIHYRKDPPIAVTRAGNGKPITINGVNYESMSEACEMLRISDKALRKIRDTSPICPLKGLLVDKKLFTRRARGRPRSIGLREEKCGRE